MKLFKKFFIPMFAVALFASLFAAPMAYAQSGKYVFDEQDILTADQFNELEALGAKYAADYGIGAYWLFTDTMNGMSDPSESQRNEFARQYFEGHKLGVGQGKNGILGVVAVKSRDYVTLKHFDNSAEDPFSNDCVNALEEKYVAELKNNNWYAAAKAYYDTVGEQMAYFKENGKQWAEPDYIGLVLKVIATIVIPLIVAVSVVSKEKAAMKTAHEQSEAGDYFDDDSFTLSVKTDDFLRTTMSVTPIPKKESSSSGGGWSDMGGGYSGSGGGKF